MTQKNYTPINDLIKKIQQNDDQKVSLPNKEAEPIPKKEIELKEVKEKETHSDLKPYVLERKETIKLSKDLKKLGLKNVSTTQFPQYESVKLPLSDEKIIRGLHAPIYSSLRWLATLALYILKQAHLSLKIVHGKVVRVLKR